MAIHPKQPDEAKIAAARKQRRQAVNMSIDTGISGPDRFEKTSWGDFAHLHKQETREQAREKIVRRYHRPLVAYQMCKGSKKYDAEDMVQSFFAHAFEKWLFERVDGSAAINGYNRRRVRIRIEWSFLSAIFNSQLPSIPQARAQFWDC